MKITTISDGKLILPALRGVMGDWVYYSTLMNFKDVSERVHYAEEVHQSEQLSRMIQRQITLGRGKQIATYLEDQKERFFNSLVVATYKGSPNWHAVEKVQPKSEANELKDVQDTTVSSVGFLTLHGDEQLFALDGQHRLAGIKRVISKGVEHSFADEVSVIFVAHLPTKPGLQRTRRLFTTLNKTAKAVSKGDIIALDEDDVMAICVRRLIEDSALFAGERIAFKATNNMPVNNVTALTTIGTLYDVLGVLFTQSQWDGKASRAALSVRPDDKILKSYFDYAVRYFELLGRYFPELKSFFEASDTTRVVKKHRGSHGGTLMFRPIGLEIMTQVIARLTRDLSLEDAVKHASKLGRNLTELPYVGLMWDTSRNLITNAHKATLREVLLHMLGKYSKWSDSELLTRYRKEAANDRLVLPRRLPG